MQRPDLFLCMSCNCHFDASGQPVAAPSCPVCGSDSHITTVEPGVYRCQRDGVLFDSGGILDDESKTAIVRCATAAVRKALGRLPAGDSPLAWHSERNLLRIREQANRVSRSGGALAAPARDVQELLALL